MSGLPTIDAEMGDRVLEQVDELWISPEIERRRTAGELPDRFVLRAAQVIFGIDEGAPEVRLNEEVKAAVTVKAARTIAKGELVTDADNTGGYEEVLLIDADPNAGHITIVAGPGGWTLAFDFRRNATRISEHSRLAREYLSTAVWAREQGYARVVVENLFSATELMAKGLLIWQPDRALLESKSHDHVRSRFNQERKLKNVDGRFADLLNTLTKLRGSARYLNSDLDVTESQLDAMLSTASAMHNTLVATTPARVSVNS